MAFDMEQYNRWPANHKHDKEPSKKIIALGKKITDVAAHMIGGVQVEDPEYWGLAEIITEEMAEVGLAMKKRTPYTFAEMCRLNKIDKAGEEKFQKLLDEMSYIGLLEYDYGYHYDHNGRTKEQTERRYILPMFVPGSAELFNMEELPDGSNPRLRDHPDVASFFERMTFIPLAGITQMVPPGGAGIGMHVIPVEKAISMENQSVDLEHISYWLKKYEGHIGVGRCSCRASRKVLGEGVADDDYGWCIGVGDFADYCRETGKGHDITYEEAMAILQRAEENGFVHQITNIDGENKIFGICNCNVNICNALRTSQLFNTPNMSRSAYVAHVDKEKCVACGRCVEYCPAGAVRLGQKLCTKDGGQVQYPKQELPDEVKWGEDKWDPDYRDNNRINSHKTGTSPCKTACPAHIAVQGYLKKASQGKYQEALALIKKQNPFPAVCGRICNRRCEEACTRGTIDEAVACLAKHFKLRLGTEVYALIATQKLDFGTIKEILMRHLSGEAEEERRAAAAEAERQKTCSSRESAAPQDALVIDDDISKIQYKLARCCNPIKGDEVFGFVTINSGITIHRTDCPNAKRMRENYPYRVIEARWRQSALGAFRVTIRIVAADTTGMANHITETISRELKLNIRSFNFETASGGCVAGTVSVEVPGAGVVDTLIHSIMRIKGVQRAYRIN